MQANMIAWAPDENGWKDAWDPSLQPTTDPNLNQRFFASVDSVSVSPIPEPAEWLMLLVGALVVGVAARRRTFGRLYLGKMS